MIFLLLLAVCGGESAGSANSDQALNSAADEYGVAVNAEWSQSREPTVSDDPDFKLLEIGTGWYVFNFFVFFALGMWIYRKVTWDLIGARAPMWGGVAALVGLALQGIVDLKVFQ